MSIFPDNGFSKAQRAYDNQMPPDDGRCYRECNKCGDEYEYEVDDDGDPLLSICPQCIKEKEEELERIAEQQSCADLPETEEE